MVDATEAFVQFADFLPEPMLLVSSSGTICSTNRRAREKLFAGVPAIAGRSITEFLDGEPERVLEYLRMCSRSREPLPGALKLRSREAEFAQGDLRCTGWAVRQGGIRLALLRLTPKEPAVGRFLTLNQRIDEMAKEISLRMRAERSAHEQREMLRVTLSSIGDAVITTDKEGRVTFMNPVAEAHTGWRLQDAFDKLLEDVFVIRNEMTRQPVESPVQMVLRLGGIVGLANHTVLIRRDGTELPIDDSGAPIRDEAGTLFGVVLVFHEIGERRNLERELRRQADALRQADKRKDDFLAMLAHELRNPLAPLHNCVQILRGERNPAGIERLADMMERQTVQLTRLVADLLDVSRITRGMIRLERKPTALSTIMQHAIETVQPVIEERRHRLDVRLPPESLVVHADLARLSQVICNLLTNAAKFMDPGGVIRMAGAEEGGWAVVRVRDYGVGLSGDLLPYVFDLFAQGDRGLDREHGGLGIGLTLVKTLVNMHEGEVSAFSEGAGKGSEFTVRLGITASKDMPSAAEPPLQPQLRKRVLIVDDNVDAAESLAMLLRERGCEVRTTNEGRSAIDLARSSEPDAILLDIGLPGMDGFEVARRLRRLEWKVRPLIVAVSGYGGESDRRRSQEAGFDHHLAKPVEMDELKRLLE